MFLLWKSKTLHKLEGVSRVTQSIIFILQFFLIFGTVDYYRSSKFKLIKKQTNKQIKENPRKYLTS